VAAAISFQIVHLFRSLIFIASLDGRNQNLILSRSSSFKSSVRVVLEETLKYLNNDNQLSREYPSVLKLYKRHVPWDPLRQSSGHWAERGLIHSCTQ